MNRPKAKSAKTLTTIDVAQVLHTEVDDGKTRKKPVLLVQLPICPRLKSGFMDDIDAYLQQLGCVAGALRVSRILVAVIPNPDVRFESEHADAIVSIVARYRSLEADQIRVVHHKSNTPFARQARISFYEELGKAKNRAGAGAIPLQLAAAGSG